MLALASGAFVEVLRGVLGGDHPDLENQVLAAGPYPGNGPPLEEGPNTNPVDLGNPTGHDLSGDPLRVRGQVVVRRKSDFARAADVDEEVAGGFVYGVSLNSGG